MATLILTAVGTAVGGPIGGAIGALAGQQADAAIFAPKARQGPRLGDLAVQTSSYGTPIPKLFGRMRVAGTVIWATDLQEHRSTSGGVKGRPSTTTYSYSASLAVALSARPIRGVGRIWADGKLLRGAAGDFKASSRYRLYLGDEEQEPDPLIAAVEGIGSAPAFRGIAYAVFEDFSLADYGNRIPSLSFEVEADPAAVSVGAIARELGEGVLTEGESPSLSGYAAGGDGVRGAIEELAELAGLALRDDGSSLSLGIPATPPLPMPSGDTYARSGNVGGPTQRTKAAVATVPDEVSIAYHDPARDWQVGLQRARGAPSPVRSERIAVPAAFDAGAAKAFAERRLALVQAARTTAKVHVGWRWSGARPGTLVQLPGEAGVWRIRRWLLHRMVVTLELAQVVGAGVFVPPAAPGRAVSEADLVHGPTVLRLLDIPLSLAADDRPRMLVAASGPEQGWRKADLMASFDGGSSWSPSGPTGTPAVIGTNVTMLPAAGSALFDLRGSLEVELLNDEMWLEGRSDAALAAGANLATLGDELIQFGEAEAIGARRFRLSRLLRGRRGTEWATGHVAGEPFVLIEAEALAPIEAPSALVGNEIRVLAQGTGDESAVETGRILTAEALRPPAPVHLKAESLPDGSLVISWVRRSRIGWSWLDEADTALGEENERYRLRLAGDGFARTVDPTVPSYLYSSADQLADGGGPLTIEVVQLGSLGASRKATTTLERA